MHHQSHASQSQLRLWPWFLAGAALGVAGTYFFDPDRGRHRRNLVRDKGTRIAKQASTYGSKLYSDLRNRGQGLVAGIANLRSSGPIDNETLLNRVRSKFGHKVRHARAIYVRVNDGEVILTGPVLAEELDELIRCVEKVPGVRNVVNHLEVHQGPDIPALQGDEKGYLQ